MQHMVCLYFIKTSSHPACRTPHTLSHSTACSVPSPDMDYTHQRTSEQSDGKERRGHILHICILGKPSPSVGWHWKGHVPAV